MPVDTGQGIAIRTKRNTCGLANASILRPSYGRTIGWRCQGRSIIACTPGAGASCRLDAGLCRPVCPPETSGRWPRELAASACAALHSASALLCCPLLSFAAESILESRVLHTLWEHSATMQAARQRCSVRKHNHRTRKCAAMHQSSSYRICSTRARVLTESGLDGGRSEELLCR